MARETRNNRPVMTPPPRTPSILHKLPAEVRLRIYPHALAVGWNDSAPNLLVALAKERDLFAEAREIYLKVNGTIHDGNARSYNTMRLNGALKLRNLMLSCRAGPYQAHQHALHGNRLFLVNNLCTISLDLTGCLQPWAQASMGALSNINAIATASKCLTRVAVRMHSVEMMQPYYDNARYEEGRENRRELIERANKGMGVKGKLERVPSQAQCFESWFWEKMDVEGGQLKVRCGWW